MQTQHSQNLTYQTIAQELASRSSIFAVCFCFLFSIAAHFANLPIWVSGFVLIALSWRCLQNLGRVKALPKWILVPLVVIGGVSVFAEYWTVVGRDAGLALLAVMTSFKILESRTHRDLLILVFLCYFLIATHFLFSQTILTASLMLVTLVVITTTLVSVNQRDDSVSIRQTLKVGARLVTLSIPLMLVLFFLVPRVPGPLWGIPNEQRGGITGLSNSMSPGQISNLIRSNEVAFRVDFDGPVPAQHDLYWRGPVMAAFNGERWSRIRRPRLDLAQLTPTADEISYTVTLEPNGEHWLLALDVPMQQVNDSFISADYQLTSKSEINDLRRYTLKSSLKFQPGLDETEEYLAYTRIYPADQNPRTLALGQQLARRYRNPEDIVNHVLKMFNQEDYVYTLTPPLLRDQVVDQFLFDSRRGFCEHYAGSFALLMRAAGIPARIVTGYQGGEYNEVGNYLIVRQSDAHAWTEVWFENRGWVRIDPTAAVSPLRIEQGLDNALPDETAKFRIQNRNPLFGNLLFGWDNLQHKWNDWVLNYDQRKQSDFLRSLKLGIDDWGDMVISLVLMLVAVTGSYWLISWWRERPPRPAAFERYFNRLLKKLSRVGLARKPAEDNRAYLQRLAQAGLPQHPQLVTIFQLYNLIKYGPGRVTEASLRYLRRLVDEVRI